MKKIILCLLMLFSLSIFAAVEKSGIKEIDSLVYSKGKTTMFFDASGTPLKTKDGATYERKIFETSMAVPAGEEGKKMYIVADYYVSTKQLGFVFITSDKFINEFEPALMLEGYIASFNEDGTLVRD